MKILTVVGARPQFIKAAVLSREIKRQRALGVSVEETLIHTGQHFDYNMSQSFFDQLDIPPPKHNLNVHGGLHGAMTGQMLMALEPCFIDEKPDLVLVYGDTNSTLAGALTAAKLHIPIAHVEAGLRSFNQRMPEEINRILTDRMSDYLLCPSDSAVNNLYAEGIKRGVSNCGDVMYDSFKYFSSTTSETTLFDSLSIRPGDYVFATCHRAETTDTKSHLEATLQALAELNKRLPVVLPLHPRTKQKIQDYQLAHLLETMRVTEPQGYTQTITLLNHCHSVVTDSGGLQKEAYFARKPCVTVRPETEWVETVEAGFNQLASFDTDDIVAKFHAPTQTSQWKPVYGDGRAGEKILETILSGK